MAFDPARAKSLFLNALELADPAERAAYLSRECGDAVDLRDRVEALLRADAAPPAPLTGTIAATVESGAGRPHVEGTVVYTPDPDPKSITELYEQNPEIETLIAGRYTLLEKIGEGGMGEVWVARQSEPVKRKVALKLIKTGMDSRTVLQRFEQERQALAMMDHPNIAKVLDAGMTPTGQPFFVMELVNGLPLNKFCDEAKLTPRERLELFVPICQAVQHAHQKGIVHRDLKPANILVTIIDARPVPKVIDFGVAKATSGKLTNQTLSTQFGMVVGTLEYMAPEQAGFSGEDIDTRADIYSLGVILYELLTGLRPIDAKRLRKAALTEMIRIIREEEPSKPSTRLSTDDALPSLAAVRQIEPRKLMALLRGDLDWVVMKCLEKRRERRYETANALSRDVQRYLDGDAVEACPPNVGYRLGKFVKRHRGQVVAAGLLLLALVAGIIGTSWGMYNADRARAALAANNRELTAANEAAERSRKRTEEREDMALKAIDNYRTVVESNPDLLIRADLRPLRQRLLEAPHDFYREFKVALLREKDEPSPSPGLDGKLWRANFALAWLNAESGSPVDALKSYQEAVDIMLPVVTGANDPSNRSDLAMIYNNLGNIQIDVGRFDDARASHEKAHALREALHRQEPNTTGRLSDLAYSEHNLGWLESKAGRPEFALTHYRRATELREQVVETSTSKAGPRLMLAQTLDNLGWTITPFKVSKRAISSGKQGRFALSPE